MKKFKFPSVLSFRRSIQPGVGYMSQKKSGELKSIPVELREERLCGSFSGYKPAKATAQEMSAGNPIFGDAAYLTADNDTLVVNFNIKFVSNSFEANNCNESEISVFLTKFMTAYSEKEGFNCLGMKYAETIANGLFLHRNKTISNELKVTVKSDKETFVFIDGNQKSDEFKSSLKELGNIIGSGLSNEAKFIFLNVEAECFVGQGQEVFPSQEFIENEGARTSETKSKVLSSETRLINGIKVKQATFHPVKIGNAIRTIDKWYEEGAVRAIAIEPYGIDRKFGLARRFDEANTFYKLFEKNAVSYLKQIEDCLIADSLTDDIHYCVACFIRGGVLSGEKKKAK